MGLYQFKWTLAGICLLASLTLVRLFGQSIPGWAIAAGDVSFGGLCMLCAILAARSGLPNNVYLAKLYWIGVLLGATWEFGFDLLGDEFCTILIPQLTLIPGERAVAHSLQDGLLFMIGYGLCLEWLPSPHFVKFNWFELGIMLWWGNISELIVDLVGNGFVWQYHVTWYNPAMFHWNEQVYTCLPQFTWLVAPCIFYLIVLNFTRSRCGKFSSSPLGAPLI